jgi:hypothetical protein
VVRDIRSHHTHDYPRAVRKRRRPR